MNDPRYLYLALEPYTALTKKLEAWLFDNGEDVSNVLIEERFFVRYPTALHDEVTRVAERFRAVTAWETAQWLNRHLSHVYGAGPHLLRLDPMLEALYQAEGLTYDLCDECGVSVPEEVFSTHSHLRKVL